MKILSNEEIQDLIVKECDSIKEMLIEKNKSYGSSALYPKKIFSKASPTELIRCRIDDKLSRLMESKENISNTLQEEDTVKDLIGYLILLRIGQKIHEQ